MEKTMEKIKKVVLDLAEQGEKEKQLITAGFEMIRLELEELGNFPLSTDWEMRSHVVAMFGEFSNFIVALLTVLHQKQSLAGVASMEAALKSRGKDPQVFFLKRVCGPLCKEGNRDAIEIAVSFLCLDDEKVIKAAQEILVSVGQTKNDQAKSDVIEALYNLLPSNTNALATLAHVDPERGTSYAVDLIGLKDEDIRRAALLVLSTTPLTEAVAQRIVAFLKSPASKAVWKDTDHRVVVYQVIQNCFRCGFLPKEDVRELIKKAFQYEGSNWGLSILVPLVRVTKNQDLLFGGFLAMETKKNNSFQLRKDEVKKFLSGLNGQQRIDYLREGLLKSNDDEFCWFAGQHLIAADVFIAAETFVEAIMAKGASKEKVATLVQLAVKVCDSGSSGEWEVAPLNKDPKARFEPIAEAIFAFAEGNDYPVETRFTIAFQPLVYGGSVKFRQRAIPIMEKILLDETCPASLFSDALQALLNNVDKKGIKKDVDDVLRNVYSKKKKEFLDGISKIIVSGGGNEYMHSLFAPAASFLGTIEAEEAVPILRNALNSRAPDGDLGLFTRSDYINILKNFALKGSMDALDAIASYRKKNIFGEVIPKTLVEIYRKSDSTIKGKVAHAVGERFLQSVQTPYSVHTSDGGLFYLDELSAIEALKDDPIVQDAYLCGVEIIGAIDHVSAGMCNIVKKALVIMPKERHDAACMAIKILLSGFALTKDAYLAKCNEKRWFVEKDRFKVMDEITAEAGMILAGA